MERVRTLSRAAMAAAAAVAAAVGPGCATVTSATKSVEETLGVAAPPQPASQLVCMWQRRLAPLPDAVRDGAQLSGLPGQMFLLTPRSGPPADITGDLTVVVYDETPRPPGQPPKTTEVWQFTADKLKQLVTLDERFGPCVALYLPWVDGWQDVTAVRILARFDAKGQPTLFAGEVRISLDQSGGPTWSKSDGTPPAGSAAGGSPAPTAAFDARSVPDPARLLKAAQANVAPPAAGPTTPQAALPIRAAPQAPAQQWPANQPAFPQMPTPTSSAAPVPGPLQPIIIPRGG